MNTKLLRKIQRTILARPKQFFMDSWFEVGPDIPNCGTAACIAGWAVTLSQQPKSKRPKPSLAVSEVLGYKLPKQGRFSIRSEAMYSVKRIATPALGLKAGQAERLYSVGNWPSKYRRDFEQANKPAEKAKVAARRIEHFIKTGGKQ